MEIIGKKISILGAVRSGVGAAKLAKTMGGIPFVSDCAAKEFIAKNIALLENGMIEFETGGHTDKVFDCDFIVTSPGVPSSSAVLIKAKEIGMPVYSELEFASWFCKGNIIAITGTNGKTTTTAMCAHVLNECGIKTYAAGNIGLAFSEIANIVQPGEFVSLEVSSFQLDYIKNFKPKFSMVLNITPDHLDRYENDFNQYASAKLKIAENQNSGEYFISNADDTAIPEYIGDTNVNRFKFSLKKEVQNGGFFIDDKLWFVLKGNKEIVCGADALNIKGEHNIANALAVLIVAKLLQLPNEEIANAFGSFPGVEHRLEFVREINGVRFINDSKSTNIDSIWYALRSFDKPIYLILGGKDKGNDYNHIKDLVKDKVKKIFAIGESAQKIYDFFNPIVPVSIMNTLEEIVEAGRKEAEANSIVLLSPACASFDMFNDYEHRGKVFKDSVNRL